MKVPDRIALWFRPAVYLGQNPITLFGAVLTTGSGFTMVLFWAFEVFSGGGVHPYLGIILFLILPGIFVLGLLLMPVGALLRRQRLIREGLLPEVYPQIDLRNTSLRHAVYWVGGLTILNVLILGTASYQGVEYMDSVQFCGQTCHSVMQPEYTAYRNSPHARVACVDCHIGPGAPWFVRSKLSGIRQVYAVMFNTYSRPIPFPVENLRPARETCEQCHWPQRFEGDKFIVRRHFSDDEKNTMLTTVLVLKIGGHTWQGSVGIHGRHLDTIERVHYISTDEHRQVIAQVTYLDDNGKPVVYKSTDNPPTPEQLAQGEHRTMDCMDCHNRPTHIFQLPENAVDEAIAEKRISPDLPFIRKKAVELLRAAYLDRDTARQQILQGVSDFYRTGYPETYRSQRQLVDTAAQQVASIYLRNIFPQMKITWGTYPNNLGHQDFPGCFRCHDGSHVSDDGSVITNDCSACHSLLAIEEENPQVLQSLGVQWR